MRRTLALFVLLVTAWTYPASAEPISSGFWSLTPVPEARGVPFYDGASWDCDACGVAFWLPPGIQYLNDGAAGPVPFRFTNFPGAALQLTVTDWTRGSLSWDPDTGVFLYDTGAGYLHTSADGRRMALFRQCGSAGTTYWLAIEDLPTSWPALDHDFNDAVFAWAMPGAMPEMPPGPVPEPGTLGLVAAAGLALVLRRTDNRRRPTHVIRLEMP